MIKHLYYQTLQERELKKPGNDYKCYVITFTIIRFCDTRSEKCV